MTISFTAVEQQPATDVDRAVELARRAGGAARRAQLLAAAERVLAWLMSTGRCRNLAVIDGLVRRCASQEGNALAPSTKWLVLHYPPYWRYDVLQALVVLGRLGMLGDPRVVRRARRRARAPPRGRALGSRRLLVASAG